MRLDMKMFKFRCDLEDVLRRNGWTPYVQNASASDFLKERTHEPSLLAVSGRQVVAIYARSKAPRGGRAPDVARFAGVRSVIVTPEDLRLLPGMLAGAPDGERWPV